ncbi:MULTISPECIES: cryptochrome/photolyase family protein [Luteimonas]|uniref:cryptochrome/photolyase family protein n=1 Tax=Luteimonas TaxID=83614 RepID=UPI000C7C6EB2|nr:MULTISPECIES: deoxyribodipyrimidine photo-lyase [Luteimonas]
MANALVWFRNDLRLDDNPALRAALDAGLAPVCVYIHAPEEEGDWAPGAASNTYRHRALAALDAALRKRGSRLRYFHGPTLATLQTLADTCEAEAVFWNRRYEPAIERRDTTIKRRLRVSGLQADSFNGALLFEPWQLETGQGGPYKVFTPFWRKALTQWEPAPVVPAPASLPAVTDGPAGVPLDDLLLQPDLDWDQEFWTLWTPGEAGAHEALEVFIDGAMRGYRQSRDRPDQAGTSRLSAHLHFGEIAPWRVVAALEGERRAGTEADIDAYIRELGWREFAHHLLHHFPRTPAEDFNPRFKSFPWARRNGAALAAWRDGMTGVPIVDAGLRELWQVGWMHNRVRMIVGSYLCKHMRVHWHEGARWFWDTLVDADLANNSLGWQWIGGTGADAAPYFRVFNPVTQAQKFDPAGEYIARWVPELAALPVPLRFSPWTDPTRLAREAPDYPQAPIVDLAAGREAALAAYQRTR